MNSSYDLWRALRNYGLLKEGTPQKWWPNAGTFEVVVGAILTQQTKWENVEKSLLNLKNASLLSPHTLSETSITIIETMIQPSGFYKKKAQSLKNLTLALVEDFGDFETFTQMVSRSWLLAQKGIGPESADAILNYACSREVMVIDSYTNRLLKAYGYEFDSYDALQEWIMHGIREHYHAIRKEYNEEMDLSTIYSRFHGKIVEYMKENVDGKVIRKKLSL